jgi:tetratricopeptide (TPR) repeat protein
MARFDKLEFNSPKQPPPAEEPAEPLVRDGGHWLNEADKHRRAGLYEAALRYYSRALELDHTLVIGWLGQVQMLVQLDEQPEAELWSRKGLEIFPNNGELLAGRAQAFCRIGDMKQAHALCDAALQQPGQSAYRWQVRGETMLAGHQNADRYCFDKAQQIASDWLVPLESAQIYLYYRKPSMALSHIRRAVEQAPDTYHLWYVQGRCQYELGLTRAAGESFTRCLELCPKHSDAKQWLARAQQVNWSPIRLLRRLFHRS